jgi:hypothetical protein
LRKTNILVVGSALAALWSASPVLAANAVGQALQDQATAAGYQNSGQYIASDIYGNNSTPNGGPGNGSLPSWSPGPHVCGTAGDCAGPTADGSSMGGLIAPTVSNGNASPEYKATPHDFSAPHL